MDFGITREVLNLCIHAIYNINLIPAVGQACFHNRSKQSISLFLAMRQSVKSFALTSYLSVFSSFNGHEVMRSLNQITTAKKEANVAHGC